MIKILLKNLISPIALVIVLFICFSCSSSTKTIEEQYEETKTYILNTNSKRIHSETCGTGQSTKAKNKEIINSNLNTLIADGYKICGLCNAGIKEKGSSFNLFKNLIENSKEIYDLELPSKEEYLNAIETMGEWYVEHIPTYQRDLQVEKLSDYNGNGKFLKKYYLKNLTQKGMLMYYVISTDLNAYDIENFSLDTKILKARERAVLYYIENLYKLKKSGILLYPCELIENSRGTYDMAGDDCVRYVFSVLNYANRNFIDKMTTVYRKNWSTIDSHLMFTDTDRFINAMSNIGFDVYDNTLNKNIKLIDEKFKLQKGDILVRNGHTHFYLGDNEKSANNFGWGKVNRDYPVVYSFDILKNKNDKYYIRMNKGNGKYEHYTRVYRYVGNKSGGE